MRRRIARTRPSAAGRVDAHSLAAPSLPAGPSDGIAPPAPHELQTTLPGALAYGRDGGLCALPDRAEDAIFFVTNDAGIRARGAHILDDVVACSKAGLFAGRRLEVTGHADPRGNSEFNRRLALRRAHAVEDYLVSRGVPPSRIKIRSHGEEKLVGPGAENWFFDRRVEISLLPELELAQH